MEWYVLVLMLSLPPSIHADLCSKQCQKCAQQILNSEVDLSDLVRRDAARKKYYYYDDDDDDDVL